KSARTWVKHTPSTCNALRNCWRLPRKRRSRSANAAGTGRKAETSPKIHRAWQNAIKDLDMKKLTPRNFLIFLFSVLTASLGAQDKKKADTEDDYYKLLRFKPPPGEVLEAGAIEIMPDNKVAVGTRRGEVWMIDNAYADDPKDVKFTRFAHGLHEILGLSQKDGWLYV